MNPKGKNCSIAALILGIVSIVLCFPYILSALAMACGIVGIICATNGQKYCLEALEGLEQMFCYESGLNSVEKPG